MEIMRLPFLFPKQENVSVEKMSEKNRVQKAYAKQLLSLLLFGMNGTIASRILLNSYEIVFLRTLIGGTFLVIVFLLSGKKVSALKNKKHFLCVIISGVAMGASWMFLYEAYSQLGVSVATLAYSCGPVIVMTLSPLVFRERLTILKVLGFAVVLTGMYFVNGSELQQGNLSRGLICGVLSAATYAVMVIFNKKALSVAGLENTMFQLVFALLTVAVFMQMKQGLVIPTLMDNIVPVLILGVINTGVGCYLYFSSIQNLPAASVAICGYLEPLAAMLFSAIFLEERLTAIQLVGAACIMCGAGLGEFSIYIRKKH